MSNPTASGSHLYGIEFHALEERLKADGVNPVHATALFRSLHRDAWDGKEVPEEWLPPLRKWWEANGAADLKQLQQIDYVESADGYTRKLLLQLENKQEIETVLMGYRGRYTACLSSQAGCAMGCVFCATGQMGFDRHLTAGEIVEQVARARQLAWQFGDGEPLRNLVLMGMGEPLHNYDAVMKALRIVSDQRGMGIAPSKITVSTVGVVPGIRRFADEKQPFHLAVSLHAVTDEERTALVPVNARWPLSALMDACRYYMETTGRRVLFGWTLIHGKNDSVETAGKVADLIKGMDCHLNLIRLNPTEGYEGTASQEEAAEKFQKVIQDAGIPCTIRQRRGIDVAAGCGQLKAANRKGQ